MTKGLTLTSCKVCLFEPIWVRYYRVEGVCGECTNYLLSVPDAYRNRLLTLALQYTAHRMRGGRPARVTHGNNPFGIRQDAPA